MPTKQSLERLQAFENRVIEYYLLLKTMTEEEQNALKKYARISNVGASTRIENALLTDNEIQWIDTILTQSGKQTAFAENKNLIEDKLSKDRDRSIEEVIGCREMFMTILADATQLISLREADLRYLHDALLRHYSHAHYHKGQYKSQTNSVVYEDHATGEKKVVFKTADAGPMTSAAMHDLVDWYNEMYTSNLCTLAITSEFVFRFLAIHPFQDGNGRLGRGLFLLGLLQSRNQALAYVSQFLAIDRYIERHKEDYYFTLNRCSQGQFSQNPIDYAIGYFFDFMLQVANEALDGIDIYKRKYDALKKLSNTALKVLDCFQENPEVRLTSSAICRVTYLPLRTVNYAIITLLQGGLIQKYGQGACTRYQLTF